MQRRHFLATALTAAGVTTPSLAQTPAPSTDSTEALARLLQQRVALEGEALVAAVVDAERVVIAGTARRGNVREGMPGADALFEYGSITKTFTALLLADMAVRNELKLDDAVEAVLPDSLKLRDSAGAPITWADLATHRSGLPRLPANLRDQSGADPYDYSRQEMLAFLAGWKASRARDAQWEYSNLGYGLLGEALAMRARSSYATLLTERVLAPLGLSDMRLALRDAPVPGLLTGHDLGGRPVPPWRFDAIAGAGALVGSARALARYAQAALGLFDHPLKPAFALALTPRAEGPQAQNRIGLAWMTGPLFDRRIANHDGGTGGFSTSLFVEPDRQRAALVLANAQVRVNDLALHLLEPRVPARDIAAEKRQTERSAVALPVEAVAALAGVYALNPQFKLTLRSRNGQLFAQATGQGEFELFAAEPRRWFARITPLELQFEGDGGAPPALLLHQAGQRLRFVRE
jgi:D-alanyl-D-alanine-carboxypeptidase/D-alanyl-D-alanine-endopeptidase